MKGEAYCRTCKQTSYSLRAVIVPVVSPLSGSWAELRDELRVLWSETTRCANWLVSELYARDIRRGSAISRSSSQRRSSGSTPAHHASSRLTPGNPPLHRSALSLYDRSDFWAAQEPTPGVIALGAQFPVPR